MYNLQPGGIRRTFDKPPPRQLARLSPASSGAFKKLYIRRFTPFKKIEVKQDNHTLLKFL
ncbi:hypothetical protein CD798_05020 [Bacillaceae bacterium SAOS 7]|nr:hypothetical protein CD798_05020 [Bacillaceae bacterium SAOS 7]